MTEQEELEMIERVRRLAPGEGKVMYKLDIRSLNELREGA